jgi:hypothetical protein
MPTEQRLSRRPAHTGAVIWLAGRMTAMSCVVRELTETGCRLHADEASRAPDRFELSLGQSTIIEQCEVVWRRADELGVRFLRATPASKP